VKIKPMFIAGLHAQVNPKLVVYSIYSTRLRLNINNNNNNLISCQA
jgi:hypothetical protein